MFKENTPPVYALSGGPMMDAWRVGEKKSGFSGFLLGSNKNQESGGKR